MLRGLFASRRGRKLALETLGPEVKAMTIDGGDHVISFFPGELIGRHIYSTGQFDRDRVEEVLSILDREGMGLTDATILDIGANIGSQTLYFALSGRVSRVVAIEPDPRNLFLLGRNVTENGLEGRVHVVAAALGDRDADVELFRSSGNHGQSSLISGAHDVKAVKVRLRPLDGILAEARVDAADVSLIWMDIEGAEPLACRSMEPLLARQCPMMMEYTPESYGVEGSWNFKAMLAGYYRRCIHFDGAKRRMVSPADLPEHGRQSDILFLPN